MFDTIATGWSLFVTLLKVRTERSSREAARDYDGTKKWLLATTAGRRTLIFLRLHVRQPDFDLARERRLPATLGGELGLVGGSAAVPGVSSVAERSMRGCA